MVDKSVHTEVETKLTSKKQKVHYAAEKEKAVRKSVPEKESHKADHTVRRPDVNPSSIRERKLAGDESQKDDHSAQNHDVLTTLLRYLR